MNFWHLAIFHAVAKSGSISTAAAQLHVSQPAVSRQLRQLETELGSVLFDRLPRGVRLTESGVLLYDYAQRIFTLEREAEIALRELQQLDRGAIAIGASSTIGNYLLPPLIAEFRRRHPGIALQVEISNTRTIELDLLNRRLTLGFIEGPLSEPELEGTVFQHDEIIPVVGASHTLARKRRLDTTRLVRETLLMRETGSGTREFVEEQLRRLKIKFERQFELGSTEAIKRVAAAGEGVAWISRLAVASELRAGTLCTLPLPQLYITRPLRWLRLRRRHLPRSAAAFLALFAPKPT